MVLTQDEKDFLDGLLEEASGLESPVLFSLHRLQKEFRCIRREHAEYIATSLNRPLTEIFEAATFYDEYSLEESGKHIVKVCRGIVCHSWSSKKVIDAVKGYLGLIDEGTTEDKLFTLHGNSCIGQCDGAPAMMVDDRVYRNLDPETAVSILRELKEGGE